MVPEFNINSVAELANSTARNLAKASISDIELREALHTERLKDGVRIGGYDIIQSTDDGETIFSIYTVKGQPIVSGLVYYDTARNLVAMFNAGLSPQSIQANRVSRLNDELRRARSNIVMMEARLEQYQERGDEFRAAVQEDRLGVLLARCRYLKSVLLSRRPVYL